MDLSKTAVAIAALLSVSLGSASAQLHLNTSTSDPVTGLSPAEWEQMVGHIVDGHALVGDPGVLVISSVPAALTVTCDKWELVGPNAYSSVKGNPQEIKPFSITYIKTKGFDGYCKGGVIGHAGIGKTVTGRLDAASGSFSDSTVILFSGGR
jgi:hypothetical protein